MGLTATVIRDALRFHPTMVVKVYPTSLDTIRVTYRARNLCWTTWVTMEDKLVHARRSFR